MKKVVYFLVIIFFSLTLVACANKAENITPLVPDDSVVSLSEDCVSNLGNWLEDFSECEYVSEDWCLENNGVFNECESACRHDDEADFCIEMCVPVCQF